MIRSIQSFLKLYLFLSLFTCTAEARVAQMPLKYFGIDEGLSNNSVTTIFKDKYGFVWVGTYDGLNRYDGSTVGIFRNVWGDHSSLNDNHINKLSGWDNKIFIGAQTGLTYYNYKDSKFYPVTYLKSGSSHPTKISNNVTALATDHSGTVFIGTDYAGLYVYNQAAKNASLIPFRNSHNSYSVQAIFIDRDDQVWLFIRDVGLCIYTKNDHKIQVVNNKLKSASCITTDKYNRIWIGTDGGLYSLDLKTGSLNRYYNNGVLLTNENITDIKFSASGEMWIATDGGGVNIIDTTHRKTTYLISGHKRGSGLLSDAISMIFQDNEARTWIATLRGGVNIIDKQRDQFKTISNDPFNPNSLINNFIISFCEDENHNLWIGTDGGGLSYWDRQHNRFTNYLHNPKNEESLGSNFVVSIIKDQENQIWLGLFNGGINRFDKRTQKFIHYSCFNPFTNTEDKNLWKLYIDSRHQIWAGTTRGGALYWYNRPKDKFEVFDERLTNIHALYEDQKGNIWAGDYSRLIKIDAVHRHHQYIVVNNPVRSINGTGNLIWIGTEGGGLLKYNTDNGAIVRYTQKDALPSNSLLNILIDAKGNLWGSTYNGLTEYLAGTGNFRNFYVFDGLQSNQFNFNAAARLQSGELAFGGINGFNVFHPDSISQPVDLPQLKVTGLQINNHIVEGNSKYSPQQGIVDLKEITVPYNDATIALNYTALEYSFPDKINYAYFLEGWDHGWNDVGKLKTAYYTRLNEGTYLLKIKATNTAGTWDSHELHIRIIVLPPWYRTWWAYLIYFAALNTLVYGFWVYRIRQTRFKYEIEIANLKVEREKELNEKKLSFFTNVSHEFRTPLTLIINPVKDLLNQYKNNEELNIVYRNARRLLGLVDHLLLFRKTESENPQLKVGLINFPVLCKEVYNCFTHQAKIKHIIYEFECDQNTVEVYLDKEKIEIALFNLISNAFKFTPDGGNIHISVKEDELSVSFEIADNGIGITADAGEKLFDKFYQVKDPNSLKTGFGIGLYLVKTFIESHHGTINYKNTAGGGATFTLCLPKGKEHFGIDEISLPLNQEPLPSDFLMEHDNIEMMNKEPDNSDLELLISDHQSILIIDDNPEIRNYIKRIFSHDYSVLEAGDGEVGLEMIKKHLPDIIISDIVMPKLNGLDLCKIVKEDTLLSHIPIILLTGESGHDIRLKGIEEGAVDFLSKPFDKDLLVARVRGIIKNKSELQNYFYSEITLKGKSRNVSEEHKDFLYKCIEVIEASLMDPELEVNLIADKMGMSYSNLYKKVKAITGQTINGFIRYVRLRKSAELMINTNCNVNEAAFKVGFNDVKYFREHFHKQFGMNPSEFIKRHRVAFQKSYRLGKSVQ
ncbi:MAG: two-component regulator propeller domain-containing protein [Mucilaginibacter sp.]|uniref:hybrid sensor histidine kinase/response regulator transcription factor n=1 Tax=Mucilaginibacter sp. TaxID=1882438 RepID=UPI003262D486